MEIILDPDGTLRNPKTLERYGWWFKVDGITYYINYKWNPKFGGEFLFQNEKSNGFIPLTGNSLVIVKAPLNHKVAPVTKSTVPRKTIQIFINNK